MLIETLSTFPNMYDSVMGTSMMRIAQEKGLLKFVAHDLRDWTHDRHRTTDDSPYGGGDGLVMKCEPIFEAYVDIARGTGYQAQSGGQEGVERRAGQATQNDAQSCDERNIKPHTIFLAPFGEPFKDATANELSNKEHLLFICGHYEGIDERAYCLADQVISLGDYVLTSGELASMVVIDAVVRKLPGVLGASGGAEDESFCNGLLEYPQYTRPRTIQDPITGDNLSVPDILLSGNHAAIKQWRHDQSLAKTALYRPDLLG